MVKSSRYDLVLLATEFPPMIGGVGRFACNLARGIQAAEIRALTLAPRGSSNGPEPVPTLRYPRFTNRRFLKIVPLLVYTLRYLRRRNGRLVIATSWTHEGLVALVLRMVTSVPYVVCCYGSEILAYEHRWLAGRLMRAVFRRAECVLAISNYSRDAVCRLDVPMDRVIVIPPAIDIEPGRGASRHGIERRLDLDDSDVLLTVARLVRRKGVAEVLCVLSELADRYPDLIYVVAGDGPDRPELERLTRDLGLTDRVRFAGAVTDDDLHALYERCTVYVALYEHLEQDTEGFGIALIEAGAHRKPVLARAGGGVADAVVDGQTGTLVESASPDEVKAALIELLDDPSLRTRFGEAGRRRVEEKFDIAQQGAAVVGALRTRGLL